MIIRACITGGIAGIVTYFLADNPLSPLGVFSSWPVLAGIVAAVLAMGLGGYLSLQWRGGVVVGLALVASVFATINVPLLVALALLVAFSALVAFAVGLVGGDSWTGKPLH